MEFPWKRENSWVFLDKEITIDGKKGVHLRLFWDEEILDARRQTYF